MARLRRISTRLAGAGALAVAGVVTLAGVASAHNPSVQPTCDSLVVNLQNYNDKVTNTVTVVIDGKTVIDHLTFPKDYKNTFPVAHDHPADIPYEVDVVAGDDPNPKPGDKNGWTVKDTGVIPTCTPTSPPPPPPSSPAPTPTHSSPAPTPTHSSPAPTSAAPTSAAPTSAAPTTSAAAVVTPTPTPTPTATATGKSLAFTGGGSDAGLIGGVGAAVVVVGGGLVVVSRRRAAGRHN
jgi:hypothetical protein